MSMQHLGELVRRAAEECGSQKALAGRLGVLPHRLSEWKSGAMSCPLEQVAIMADIAGLQPEEWVVRAMLLNAKEKPYYERLEQALGKSLLRTGAASDSSLPAGVPMGSPGGTDGGFSETVRLSTMYIMFNRRRTQLFRALRLLRARTVRPFFDAFRGNPHVQSAQAHAAAFHDVCRSGQRRAPFPRGLSARGT